MRERRHPSGLFSLSLPDDWSVEFDVENVALIAIDPVDDFDFHPNLVVTIEQPAPDTPTDAWFRAQPTILQETLQGALLIDVGHDVVAEQPALRMLLHHFVDRTPVTLEQWSFLDHGLGWFISASTASLSYDNLADRFHECLNTFAVHPSELP